MADIKEIIANQLGGELNLQNILGKLKGLPVEQVEAFVKEHFGSNEKFVSTIGMLKSAGKVSEDDIKQWPEPLRKLLAGGVDLSGIADKAKGLLGGLLGKK